MKAVNRSKNTVLAERLILAATFRERLVGLIGTDRLERGSGLLLIPCRAVHTYFMRYAIDAVYLDGSGRVVKVIDTMLPYTFGPVVKEARAVLELPAGTCRGTSTEEGDLFEFVQEVGI
ncbi:DUF192 domain-containing protein [Thermosediminibacter litoriperuensis]|uniref:DUF192 domain-containing protein n=1 Tax=Thermosediminibacter litoriperuensis TaxID=291989 RepID=A0A5S5AQ58_9FIRM|nr:DUF192 domain-containing protein [Thermosediminibacter litoriperuensis]TYP53776.1 hypothetical protein LZ11_01498 [Thermosediminibacter litoriperuensis]